MSKNEVVSYMVEGRFELIDVCTDCYNSFFKEEQPTAATGKVSPYTCADCKKRIN